jgi:CarD family transcriptional regulator
MFSKAKKILASELMYARDINEEEATVYLEELLTEIHPSAECIAAAEMDADALEDLEQVAPAT